MTAISLLAVHFILSFAAAQFTPINISAWEIAGNADNVNCEIIGGYNYATNKIQIYGGHNTYGGSDEAKYVYNPDNRTYEYQNLSFLSAPLSVTGDTTQRHGDTPDNVIYFISGSGPQIIEGIDMTDDSRAQYATLDSTKEQRTPGLCMDDDTNTLYVVGDGEIEVCTLNKTTPQTCTRFDKSSGLDNLREMSCEYYNANLYIFGGRDEGGVVNTVVKCDPIDNQQTCTELTSTLIAGRTQVAAVKIECFKNNYIALIGGELNTGDASSVVEIYDVDTEQRLTSLQTNMDEPRRHFVAVFDKIRQQIFAFGGIDNAGTSCLSQVDVTTSGPEGLCYTMTPTMDPTEVPSMIPTQVPSVNPTDGPTNHPTGGPTDNPTGSPAKAPTIKPSAEKYTPQTGGFKTSGPSYAIMIVILIIICCIILLCFWWYSKEEKEHEYGRMKQQAGGGGGGGAAIAMTGVVVTYCDNCGKATPCTCNTCTKCGKSECNNDCGLKCQNCGTTQCDGNSCRE